MVCRAARPRRRVARPGLRGARIAHEVLDEAAGRGLADLRVAIDPLNVAALRFWHRLGFARIEKIVTRDPDYTLLELVNDLDRASAR